MKFINKQPEPGEFTDWKAQNSNNIKQPVYDDLRGEVKGRLKEALMQEQGSLCCYCERRLTPDDSHIEHVKPQSDFPEDSLDYTNLLCSCQKQLQRGEPRHCGHKKDKWFDEQLLISPLDPECENQFAFTADGEIFPASASNVAALETIEKLSLDIKKLNDFRSKAIEPFLDDSLDENEIRQFVMGYLYPDDPLPFNEFWTTIKYLFGNLQLDE